MPEGEGVEERGEEDREEKGEFRAAGDRRFEFEQGRGAAGGEGATGGEGWGFSGAGGEGGVMHRKGGGEFAEVTAEEGLPPGGG